MTLRQRALVAVVLTAAFTRWLSRSSGCWKVESLPGRPLMVRRGDASLEPFI
jgi:hypothetical protein